MPQDRTSNEDDVDDAEFDHRGTNWSALSAAHSLAHERDVQRKQTGVCTKCGKTAWQADPTSEEPPTLKSCGRCKSAAYCSRDCQVSDYKSHKVRCKAIVREKERRKAEEKEAKKHSADGVEAKATMNAIKSEHSGDPRGEARELVRLLRTTENVQLALRILDRLKAESELLSACHELSIGGDGDDDDDLYAAMRTLVERDVNLIKSRCFVPADADGDKKGLVLLSWNAVLAVLATHPSEPGHVPPTTGKRAIASYSPERCEGYFAKSWTLHLELLSVLWIAVNLGHPSLFTVCKDLWRQLPLCLVHENTARAVLRTRARAEGNGRSIVPISDRASPALRPLLDMLDLNDTADDLEGLTNQVAALLVVQAGRINSGVRAVTLERSITEKMDRAEIMQWKKLSVPVAEAMVEKGAQLDDLEFHAVLQRAGLAS